MPVTQEERVSQNLMQQFVSQLTDRMGLYYPKERWSELLKKLRPFKEAGEFESMETCLEWLLHHFDDESHNASLAHYLTMGESYFFRDAAQFAALETNILPELIAKNAKTKKLRIWSAGCCTGEELYSLAILLHRLLPDLKQWKIQLIGTDINQEFLKRAQKGIYKSWSLRSTPEDYVIQYFTKNKDDYQLLPEIKKMVQFLPLDLTNNHYPDELQNLDLILCNNVLTFFSKKQVADTLSHLTETLREQGWLGVATTEAAFINQPSLNAHSFSNARFFKKELEQRASTPKPTQTVAKQPKKGPHSPPPSPEEIFQMAEMLYLSKQYHTVVDKLVPLLSAIQRDSTAMQKKSKEIILLIRTFTHQKDLPKAQEWCERALQANKRDHVLYYLLAEVQAAKGNRHAAISSLKNAIFLNSSFSTAHYLLGILEQQQGNEKAALREFKQALDLIHHLPPNTVLPGSEELTVEKVKDFLLAHAARM